MGEPAKAAPESTPESTPPEVSIRFDSKKVDDRKNKSYGRRLSVHAYFDLPGDPESFRRARNNQKRSISTIAGHAVYAAVRARNEAHDDRGQWLQRSDSYGGGIWSKTEDYSFRVFFESEKPSLILDEDECVRALGGEEELRAFFQDAVTRGLATASDEHATEDRARDANRILGFYTEKAEKAAQIATRYEQRIAALTAELKSEYLIQGQLMLDEMGDDDPGWDESKTKERFDPRSIQAAKSKLIEKLKGSWTPHERSGFLARSGSDDFITTEDVE